MVRLRHKTTSRVLLLIHFYRVIASNTKITLQLFFYLQETEFHYLNYKMQLKILEFFAKYQWCLYTFDQYR